MMINYDLFQFTFIFAIKLTDWPTCRLAVIIELADCSFNPVLEDLGQPPNEVVLNESRNAHVSAANSQGEIL